MGDTASMLCIEPRCSDERVSGSDYCENHQISHALSARRPTPSGTLAQLIRNAKGKGLIAPVSSGYQSG